MNSSSHCLPARPPGSHPHEEQGEGNASERWRPCDASHRAHAFYAPRASCSTYLSHVAAALALTEAGEPCEATVSSRPVVEQLAARTLMVPTDARGRQNFSWDATGVLLVRQAFQRKGGPRCTRTSHHPPLSTGAGVG